MWMELCSSMQAISVNLDSFEGSMILDRRNFRGCCWLFHGDESNPRTLRLAVSKSAGNYSERESRTTSSKGGAWKDARPGIF